MYNNAITANTRTFAWKKIGEDLRVETGIFVFDEVYEVFFFMASLKRKVLATKYRMRHSNKWTNLAIFPFTIMDATNPTCDHDTAALPVKPRCVRARTKPHENEEKDTHVIPNPAVSFALLFNNLNPCFLSSIHVLSPILFF